MRCEFCGREVENTVVECPYCHYQFKREAQVLNPNERDSFEGVTIFCWDIIFKADALAISFGY